MASVRDDFFSSTRISLQVAAALALLALLLASIGVYGVISYSVEQRKREIGVRIALGARPGEVVALVVGRNAAAIAGGLIAGLAISWSASRVIENQLYGLPRHDPIAYAGVILVLALAGILASVIPARRAASTDAVEVLRCD